MGKTNANYLVAEANIWNAMRNNASIDYKRLVPSATPENILQAKQSAGDVFMQWPGLKTEFYKLLKQVSATFFENYSWDNPFKIFDKGYIAQGGLIQKAFVEPAKSFDFDIDRESKTLFATNKPDIKFQIATRNFKRQYKVTFSDLQAALVANATGIADMLRACVDSLYTKKSIEEYQMILYMIGRAIVDGRFYVDSVSNVDLHSTIAKIRETSLDFSYPDTKLNIAGVTTATRQENKAVLISNHFDATSSVDVLAYAFNLEKQDFLARKINYKGFKDIDQDVIREIFTHTNADGTKVVDPFYRPFTDEELAALSTIDAVYMDKNLIQNWHHNTALYTVVNEPGEYVNYTLNTWQSFFIDIFAQAVVFAPVTPTVESVTLSPVTTEQAPAIISKYKYSQLNFTALVTTSGFAPKAVVWDLTGADADKFTIDAAGNLTLIDETATGVTVTCTSVFDSTKTATAYVSVAQ